MFGLYGGFLKSGSSMNDDIVQYSNTFLSVSSKFFNNTVKYFDIFVRGLSSRHHTELLFLGCVHTRSKTSVHIQLELHVREQKENMVLVLHYNS